MIVSSVLPANKRVSTQESERIGAKSRTNIYQIPKALFYALEMLQ